MRSIQAWSILLLGVLAAGQAMAQSKPEDEATEQKAKEGRSYNPRREGFVILYAESKPWVIVDPAVIREIEEKLQAHGFYPGVIDGKADPILHAALERFQGKGPNTRPGQLDKKTAKRLGIDWGELLRVRRPFSEKGTREFD